MSADGDAAAGELHDQPHLGDRLHPVARDRDDLAGEVAAVVGDAKGGEGAADGGASRAASSSSSRSRMSAARVERGAVLGLQRAQALGEEGVLARARRSQQRAARRRVTLTSDERPVGRVGVRARRGPPPRAWRAAAWRSGAGCARASASSLGVSGPWRSMRRERRALASGDRPTPASWRSRRAVRVIAEAQAGRRVGGVEVVAIAN